MFPNTPDVAFTVAGLAFRTKNDKENDKTRTADVVCHIPLTRDLVKDISSRMADDLYVMGDLTGDTIPRPDVRLMTFEAPNKLYIVKLSTSPGRPTAKLTLSTVAVRKMQADRGDEDWVLAMTLSWPLVASKDALLFIDHLHGVLYATFEIQQGEIDYDTAAPAPEDETVATVDEEGVVESVKPKKRGPRLVKDPSAPQTH